MHRDLRESAFYREAKTLCWALRQPGTEQISDAAEVHVSPDQRRAVFTGSFMDMLQGVPRTRIGQVDLTSGDMRVLTFGSSVDRLPKWSPDGRQIAFLSDRHSIGGFQLYLMDSVTGAVRPTPRVGGWVEYLHWSPDGRRILLGVAGHGADMSSGQGAVSTRQVATDLPSWMPVAETGDESYRWRRAWVYEVVNDVVHQVTPADINVWESVWCGSGALAAVVSFGPGEGLWYSAQLHIIDIETRKGKAVYAPEDQIGWPSASPAGTHLAIVEAICSDRRIVAGDLRVVEIASGKIRHVDTGSVDISYVEWRSSRQLLLGGYRGLDTVIGLYDAASDTFTEVWKSRDITAGARYLELAGLSDSGDCVLVGENFVRAPEIAVIRNGEYRVVKSFGLGHADEARVVAAVECVGWQAPDGLEIQGWLLRPRHEGPHPLVMIIHGGPVSHWRANWLGRNSQGLTALMLLRKGYAVFLPNPRGSSGRGQDFVRHVLGEMCGADTYDLLSGLDHLVERGIADPKRLGVTGRSYGGLMTAWVITQDSRFAAAAALAPVTNHVSASLVSNIPQFLNIFLADTYANSGGKYFERSPIMHANKVKTPMLHICGALDRCAPPEEAVQFHNALLQNSVTSVLVTYPEEGHGISKFPAVIDYVARMVAWFQEHMPSRGVG